MCFSWDIFFIILAGLPTATTSSAKLWVTTLPAPIKQFLPMVIPGKTVTLAQITEDLPTTAPPISPTQILQGGYGSLVKVTPGAMMTPSAKRQFSTKQLVCIRTLLP